MSPMSKEMIEDELVAGIIDEEGIETEEQLDDTIITEPFDPSKIRVNSDIYLIQLLIERLKRDEIDLEPGFQRKAGIWNAVDMSRLIESLLLKIPLPAFYIDATDEDNWLIIDGLQRLTAIKKFIVTKELKLVGLEFLTQYNGYNWDSLPRNFQRRILETHLTFFKIESGTPSDVKYIIFKRINTGGKPLSAQEIRHALNQGKSTEFLHKLANTEEFKNATWNSVSSDRMVDRELCLRFLAFTITPWEKYKVQDLDNFLINAMEIINKSSDEFIISLERKFIRSMDYSYKIFGGYSFRKYYGEGYRKSPINKALFEAWSVNIDRLSDDELMVLIKRKLSLMKRFKDIMWEHGDFIRSISQSTGNIKNIKIRFSTIENIIHEVIDDKKNSSQKF